MSNLNWDWPYKIQDGQGFFLVLSSYVCNYRKCRGCTMWRLNEHGTPPSIAEVTNQFLSTIQKLKLRVDKITEISVSNCGSLFDQDTIPFKIVETVCREGKRLFPNLKRVILESRPKYATEELIKRISTICVELDITFFVCIGLEIWDARLRNKQYKKDVPTEDVVYLINRLSKVEKGGICLYLMYKPLKLMDADRDIIDALKDFRFIPIRYKIPVMVHINPTYVAKDTWLDREFQAKRYKPPTLADLRKLIENNTKAFLPAENFEIRLGLSDEGLAVEGGSFRREGDEDDYAWLLNWMLTPSHTACIPNEETQSADHQQEEGEP